MAPLIHRNLNPSAIQKMLPGHAQCLLYQAHFYKQPRAALAPGQRPLRFGPENPGATDSCHEPGGAEINGNNARASPDRTPSSILLSPKEQANNERQGRIMTSLAFRSS